MLFALSGANCFNIAQNTHPLLFLMTRLITQQPGALYGIAKPLSVWYIDSFSQFHCFSLILFPHPSPHISSPLVSLFLYFFFSQLVSSPIAFVFFFSFLLISFFHFFSPLHSCPSLLLRAFFSFICLRFLLAPLSSACVHRAACNHICTTSCQFDRIHASVFCHLCRKRDWGLLSYLSHISVGRTSIKSIWK